MENAIDADGCSGDDGNDVDDVLEVDAVVSGETKETTVSGITFLTDANTDRTAGGTRRVNKHGRVNRHDVKQIFKASSTTGTVTMEQLLRIKNMHEKIDAGIHFDFNYCWLLIVASVVAGLGLASDSSTTVISSMLLSPIMGPVIGMSYGVVIWDLPLVKRSARNEILSIAICVLLGFIIGLCCHWTEMAKDLWPTQEMINRGTRTTFLCGIPIAFFSGLGVALSVLDDQTSSLVGVAISASLLPPAVNCGMMFIVAFIKKEDLSDWTFDYKSIINGEEDNFGQMGITSLLLTVANVIMVALGATLMFRVKEVLPVKKKVFWDDLKVARRIYQGRAIDPMTGEALTVEDLVRWLVEEAEGRPSPAGPVSKFRQEHEEML